MNLKKISFYLLVIIALCSPWGDLIRFGSFLDSSANRGITSIAAMVLIFIGLYSGNILKVLNNYTYSIAFFCFLLLSGLASFLAVEVNNGTYLSILLAIYCLLSLSIGALKLSNKEVMIILSAFTLSAALMSLVSIADYYEVINIQLINRVSASRGLGIPNLLGPFSSQTVMAGHIVLAFPLPITVLFLKETRWPSRFFWGLILCPILYAGILTFSRGLFLSFFAVIGYLFMITVRIHGYNSLIKVSLACLTFLSVAIFSFSSYAPDQYEAFIIRLNGITPTSIQESRSDTARLHGINSTVEELKKSPLGLGFVKSEYQVGASIYKRSSHSNVVEILRAGGPLGFSLVIVSLFPIISKICCCKNLMPAGTVFATLVSFFVYGLTHVTLVTLFAWILIGIAVGWQCQKPRITTPN